MTSKTDFERVAQAKAKALDSQSVDDCNERDSLAFSEERTGALYQEACGDGGNPTSDAEDLHRQLCDFRLRRSRVESRLIEAKQQRADLARTLGADAALDAAESAVGAARKIVASITKKLGTNAAAIARWQALADEAFAASQAARATLVSIARYSLPDDVRAELGIVGQPPAAPAIDPGTLEQRGVGFAEAVEQAQRQDALLQSELAAAQQAEEQAVIEWMKQRAYQAEFEHAIALAGYLPILAKHRATHELAFSYAPELPAYARIVANGRGAAMEAARATAEPQIEAGLLERVKAAVRSLT